MKYTEIRASTEAGEIFFQIFALSYTQSLSKEKKARYKERCVLLHWAAEVKAEVSDLNTMKKTN